MKAMIAHIDLIIECRDYRTPLVSRNPMFEETLGEKPRLIVYTKQDLGSTGRPNVNRKNEDTISRWNRPSRTLFANVKDKLSVRKILNFAEEYATSMDSLTSSRMMVVGMPNVGKSSLLNALRNVGLGLKKAARTGDQPGVTRKISTGVKIIEGKDGQQGVYLVDSPGVFVPYVPDAETMLKLALCGNIKDTIIPPTTIADYLLFHLNLQDPSLYHDFSEPTNEIFELLDKLGRKYGRLLKGGVPDLEAAALQFIQRWRSGLLGHFILDDVTPDAVERRTSDLEAMGGSMSQARKAAKETRREQIRQRYVDAG